MKDLITLASYEDVHDFMGKLWKSAPFQESYAQQGFVYKIVDQFAYLPRYFARVSNDQLERAHFSTWWNVIMLRDYDNPIVHDLYYLHEMTHASTMPYVDGIGRAAFDEKMQRNELEASVLSEIAVYLEMPELREQSFKHEIYADRFLNGDGDIRRLWNMNKPVALETLRTMRRHVMVSKAESQMDLTEKWIRRFAEQNAAYSITWADRYKEVEGWMSEFQILASVDRQAAAESHAGWLHAQMLSDPVDGIPFRQEAELFSPFYWANKAKYDEAMKAANGRA